MTLKLPTTSVVIPVYRGAESLAELTASVVAVLQKHCLDHEVIFVNDDSPDGSWLEIRKLCQQYPSVRGIDLMRNSGQHAATLVGLKHVRMEIAVTMDDDLQHPAEHLPLLIRRVVDGCDVVYANRLHETHGFFRGMASRNLKRLMRLTMGSRVAPDSSSFRGIRSSVLKPLKDYDNPFIDLDAMLCWVTNRFDFIEVEQAQRSVGESSQSLRSLISHTWRLISSFTTFPLKLAAWIGFFFTFFGLVLFIYVLYGYLTSGGPVPGFAFLASALTIFSGAQLFAIGLLGGYLANVHSRTMGQPGAIVRQTVGKTDSGSA